MNIGYIENILDNGDVRIRIYYDKNFAPVGDLQPLIDNPDATGTAYCLEVVNTSGRKAAVFVTRPNGTQVRVNIPRGRQNLDWLVPSVCQTAAQLALVGLLTRGDVTDFTISDQDNALKA